jgi:tetratricopeptide (TPR) repeat protein
MMRPLLGEMMRKICLAVLLLPALAWAQPRTPKEWYEEGENQYNLGNFEKAVEAFKQAFSLEPNESKKAIYLFNVAQSYRQANDCKNAHFFYKRFLALKENDTVKPLSARTRKDVEERISELEACAQQAASISKKPPNNNLPPDGEKADKEGESSRESSRKETHKEVATSAPGTVQPSDPEDEDTPSVTVTGMGPPRLISLRFGGGGTAVFAGDKKIPVQATFALVGGYPIPVNSQLTVEVGAALTFTPLPADLSGSTMGSKVTQLWGLLANVGATYEVYPKLGLRGDAGLGALFFANAGNTAFIDMGGDTTGALTIFHLRLAASADYAVTPNLMITATPLAFTYSPPKGGLASDIKSITSLDFMIGVGYRK